MNEVPPKARPSRSFLGNISIVGSGGGLAQFIQIGSIPIITRIYSPQEYALWALVMTSVAILGSVATFRLDLAILLPKDRKSAQAVAIASSLCALAVGGTFLLFLLLFLEPFLRITGTEQAKHWVYLTPLLITANGLYQTANSYLSRNERFTQVAVCGVFFTGGTALSQVALGLAGFTSAGGLLTGSVAGQTLAFILAVGLALMGEKREIPWSQVLREAKDSFVRYRVYPQFMTPYTLVGSARDRGLLYVLAAFVSPAQVGFFALAQKMVGFPISLIASAIRPVLYQMATTSTAPRIRSEVLRLQSLLLGIGTPIVVWAIFEAPLVFSWVFGEAWRDAGVLAAIMAPPYFLFLLISWMDRLFDVHGKQRLALALELGFSLLVVGTFVLGLSWLGGLIPALVLQSIVLCAYYSLRGAILFSISRFGLPSYFRILGQALLYGGSSLLVVALIHQLTPSPWWPFATFAALGTYLAVRLRPTQWDGLLREAA